MPAPRPSIAQISPLSLETRIYERISARLGPRIRNLSVRVLGGRVRLQGECSTYYSKQLAQEATLGVLEHEAVDNEIVVAVREISRP